MTSSINPNHRAQIERELGRPLTEEELQPVASLDALTEDQIAIAAQLRPHNRIAPHLFLRAVVPSAMYPEIEDLLENRIQDMYIARRPPPDLPNRALFELHAGRALEPAEQVRIATIYDMSPAQIALGEILAKKDVAIAFLYLSRIAPNETIEVRHDFAKHLAGLV
jgi:hypothetical protein